jgi:hypothetical protein
MIISCIQALQEDMGHMLAPIFVGWQKGEENLQET